VCTRLQMSTDRGATWCNVPASGVPVTDTLHGGTQDLCTMPASSLVVKVGR
jgi:hypothetical protein